MLERLFERGTSLAFAYRPDFGHRFIDVFHENGKTIEISLEFAADAEEAMLPQDFPEKMDGLGFADEVDETRVVFQRKEEYAFGRRWRLTDKYHAEDKDRIIFFRIQEFLS